MIRKFVIASAALALSGCSVGGVSSAQYDGPIRTADAASVENCEFLSDVIGTSGLYGMFAKQGVINARHAAYAEAEKLDATHVVWTSVESTYGSSQAYGRTYRCNEAEE